MPKYQFKCPGCGETHDYALLDGYHVGDRLLEGVMFEIRIADDGTFTATPAGGDMAWLSGLDAPMWIGRAAETAAKWDLFTCPDPKCRDDIENPTDY